MVACRDLGWVCSLLGGGPKKHPPPKKNKSIFSTNNVLKQWLVGVFMYIIPRINIRDTSLLLDFSPMYIGDALLWVCLLLRAPHSCCFHGQPKPNHHFGAS